MSELESDEFSDEPISTHDIRFGVIWLADLIFKTTPCQGRENLLGQIDVIKRKAIRNK